MSKGDDFLLPFPTRHGEPSGHANERQMADKVDRASIRTVIRTSGDGSEVMLRTRAGFNEYTTNQENKLLEEAPPCKWSYDYFPIRLDGEAYISDTATSLGNTIYQSSVAYGLKGRRKGLSRNSDGTMSLKLQESHEDLPTGDSKMTGPGFWYSKGDTVTWTYSTLIPSENPLLNGMEVAMAYSVRYKKEEVTLRSLVTYHPENSDHILAACVVRDSVGVIYIRVAYLKVDGDVGEGITVSDYTTTGSSVSTTPLNPTHAFPQWVDGFRFTAIKPRLAAFSPDGTKLAFIVADYIFDATGGERCVVAEISRPLSGESPSATLYVATLPVGWEAVSPPSNTDVTTPYSNSYTNPDSAYILTDIATGSVISQSDPPTLPSGPVITSYSESRSERNIVQYSAQSYFAIDRVGFSRGNELCVVATKTMVSGTHHVRMLAGSSDKTEKSGVVATDTVIGGENLHSESYGNYTRTRIASSYGDEGSFENKTWDYDITTYFIRNGAIVWSKATPLTLSGQADSWERETIIESNVVSNEDYYEGSASGALPSGYPSTVKVGVEVHGVDFYDSTILTRSFGPAAGSTEYDSYAKWAPSYHKYEEAYLVSSSGLGTIVTGVPTEFSQTFQVVSGDAGKVYAPYTIVRKEFYGPAAWCPTQKEAVYLYDHINEETWGLFFSKNKWKTIRAADGEPTPPAEPGTYYEIKVGLIPFA